MHALSIRSSFLPCLMAMAMLTMSSLTLCAQPFTLHLNCDLDNTPVTLILNGEYVMTDSLFTHKPSPDNGYVPPVLVFEHKAGRTYQLRGGPKVKVRRKQLLLEVIVGGEVHALETSLKKGRQLQLNSDGRWRQQFASFLYF